MEKPRLRFPAVPLTPAADDYSRIAPQMENSVVGVRHPTLRDLTHRRTFARRCRLQWSAPPPQCRGRVHSSDRRSEHRTEFRDRPGAPTSGRRTAHRACSGSRPAIGGALRKSFLRPRRFLPRILRRVFWSARPRHRAEPASRCRRATRPAGRKPPRRLRGHTRRTCRSLGLAWCQRRRQRSKESGSGSARKGTSDFRGTLRGKHSGENFARGGRTRHRRRPIPSTRI